MYPETPTAAGQLIYVPPGADHACAPPTRTAPGYETRFGPGCPTEPTAPDGSIWRCGCGRTWTAARRPRGRTWRPATWPERAKARLMSHRGVPALAPADA